MISVKPSEKFEIEKGMTRVPKALPEKFEQKFFESEHHFMNRLNRMVAKSIAEANLEEHFDVDLGEKIENNADNIVDVKKVEKRKEKNKMKNLKRKERKLKKQHKFLKQLNDVDEFNFKKDFVAFGEVVHAPPILNFKK